MRAYRRFKTRSKDRPILFFVGVFVLGTLLLVVAFVRLNKKKVPTVSNMVDHDESSPLELPILKGPDTEEYLLQMHGVLNEFMARVTQEVGVWVTDEQWEELSVNAYPQIDANAKALHEGLLAVRVPSAARQQHIQYVLTVDALRDVLEKEQGSQLELQLLRIEAFVLQLAPTN